MPQKFLDDPRDKWPAPRGPKPEWPTLLHRPEDSYDAGEDVERAAVANYIQLIAKIRLRARVKKMSVRDVARASGVGTSGVAAMFTGSAWPRLNTMRAVAAVVDGTLHIDGDTKITEHLVAHIRTSPYEKFTDVAFSAGVRRNTVSELDHPSRSPSMLTVLAVAADLGLTVDLRIDLDLRFDNLEVDDDVENDVED